ncbi:hypothetical protein Kopi_049 [Pseudomonas phage Kopi]|uniref:Uncharacterized protein n=1 Tax=Pseudomonas phage Kopi TaxID=2880993 RepID=A0AAE8Y3V3_9CAUD|nr:hypothetical protein PM397_gp49 [Pseudomonas phage Kopi]UDF60321.1 hypothetical protein Kopi_049 [Pseudomonas phage Kopi]
MAKKYYSLLTKENGKWYPQFGDYSRPVVEQEREDAYNDSNCKIICTDDNQAAIDQKVKELNEG